MWAARQEPKVGPDFHPDVPLLEVLLYGVFNPATIIVAFLMGRKADDKSKIMIAAFAGAVAGAAVLYLVTLLRLWDAPSLGRAAAGVFITSLVAGFIYAGVGFLSKRWSAR
jgi:hypothetical protein